LREAVVQSASTFLRENPGVSGILAWWDRETLHLSAREIAVGSDPISLIKRGDERSISDTEMQNLFAML
jgi:hypothetical protein